MNLKLRTYLLSGPEIPREIIAQDKILVIRISKKVALGDWLVLLIKKLKSILV
jgi:hypothetical protein